MFHHSIRCWLWLALVITPLANATEPMPDMVLHYVVRYSKIEVGKIETRIRHTADGFDVVSHSTINGAARFILGNAEVKENARYRLVDGRPLPLRYTEQSTGRKAVKRTATFDWSRHQVRFDDGEVLALAQSATIEAGSFPAALLLQPAARLPGKVAQVLSARGFRSYTYGTATPATVTTPAGAFETLRVARQRQGRSGRRIIVWLVVRGALAVPVRIARVSGNTTTLIELAAATGIKLAP